MTSDRLETLEPVDTSDRDTVRDARVAADTSLIICTRDRHAMLADSVASILDGTMLPEELIIVDQSVAPHPAFPHDSTEPVDRIRYLWTTSQGLSRGNNNAVSSARYQWLVFTHDDVLVEKDWLERLVTALKAAGERTVVTGRILSTETAESKGYAPTLQTATEAAEYEGRIGIDVLKPLNMAMHRSALDAVGGFDEELGPGTPFPGAEDSDLGFRLLEAGYRISYVPEAVLYHRAWRRSRDYLPLRWRYGLAQGAFFAKHLSRHDRYMAARFAADVRRRVRRFPRRLLREPVRALGDPLYVAGNLAGAVMWKAGRRERKRKQSMPT